MGLIPDSEKFSGGKVGEWGIEIVITFSFYAG